MEKLIYPVWKNSTEDGDAFREKLLHKLAPELLADCNVRAARIAVVDSAVEAAAGKRMETCQTLPDGIVSIWVNAATGTAAIEQCLANQGHLQGQHLLPQVLYSPGQHRLILSYNHHQR